MKAVHRWCAASGVVCGIVLTGCDKDDIHAQRVPLPAGSPSVAAPAPQNPHANGVPTTPSPQGGKVTWSAPQGWEEQPTTQQMRLATYKAMGVEITVAAFPGDVGGMLANINRWRGQIGAAPVTDAELPTLVSEVQKTPSSVSITSMAGAGEKHLLGAIITPGDGQTWFVKAVASAGELEKLRPSFEEFAKSFRMGAGTQAAPAPTAPTPSAAPSMPPALQGMGTSNVPLAKNQDTVIEERLMTWKAPEHWKAEAGGGGIIAAGYTIENTGGKARATVTSLNSDGGGTLANVNRWRDQLGLSPATDITGTGAKDLGKGAVIVDLSNTAGSDRMVAAVVPAGNGSTWFFKLRGAPAAVEAEKASFESMVKGVGLGEK